MLALEALEFKDLQGLLVTPKMKIPIPKLTAMLKYLYHCPSRLSVRVLFLR